MKPASHSLISKPDFRLGFTLIEIMIVVALIGLILTTGVPSVLRSMKAQGMAKAVNDICEACRNARADAVINQKTSPVTIHPNDGGVSAANFTGKIPEGVSILILGVNFIELTHADSATVNFYANGTSDEFTILLQGSEGELKQLDLDIITGFPVVEDPRNKR